MVTDMDKVFKAFADRGRKRLLDLLHAYNEQPLGDLCEHLDITRQAVTKHFALLGSDASSGSEEPRIDLGPRNTYAGVRF